MDLIQQAINETNEHEHNFNKIMTKEISEFIEHEIYECAMTYALRNPKWKGNGFPEYLVNWFKI